MEEQKYQQIQKQINAQQTQQNSEEELFFSAQQPQNQNEQIGQEGSQSQLEYDESQLQDFIDNLNRRTSEYRQSMMIDQRTFQQIRQEIQVEEDSPVVTEPKNPQQAPQNIQEINAQQEMQFQNPQQDTELDPNAFIIRNLDTGDEVDLRNNNIDNLEKQFNQLFGSTQNQSVDQV